MNKLRAKTRLEAIDLVRNLSPGLFVRGGDEWEHLDGWDVYTYTSLRAMQNEEVIGRQATARFYVERVEPEVVEEEEDRTATPKTLECIAHGCPKEGEQVLVASMLSMDRTFDPVLYRLECGHVKAYSHRDDPEPPPIAEDKATVSKTIKCIVQGCRMEGDQVAVVGRLSLEDGARAIYRLVCGHVGAGPTSPAGEEDSGSQFPRLDGLPVVPADDLSPGMARAQDALVAALEASGAILVSETYSPMAPDDLIALVAFLEARGLGTKGGDE